MLSSKRTAALQRPTAWDRSRVGERLQAALAGLQELHLLREKQETLVTAALAMQPAPAVTLRQCNKDNPGSYRCEELRLEATLTVLKEQLSRLRRQDVGLKSHLDQLDQQISELKLDVNKSSNENLDSDSRPSSGFYELSDGASCSLSNSCTSVYSECLSASHSSLHPFAQQSRNRLSVFDYRPKSVDETTVHVSSANVNLQNWGVCSMDINENKNCSEFTGNQARSRPRPVSTGDLDRLIPTNSDFQMASDLQRVSTFCHGNDIQFHNVDPKYQSDLVSKRGIDIYPYPSPLHAVALQSPLFALSDESQDIDPRCIENKNSPNSVSGTLLEEPQLYTEQRPGGYINKLLQLSKCKANNQSECSERALEKNQPAITYQRLVLRTSPGGLKINSSNCLKEKQVCTLEAGKQKGNLTTKQNVSSYDVPDKQQNSLPSVESKTTNINCVSSRLSTIMDTSTESIEVGSYSTITSEDSNHQPSNLQKRIIVPQKINKCNNPKNNTNQEIVGRYEFVQAKFVPAESHQIKFKCSSSKNKSDKLKRRNSEKIVRPVRSSRAIDKPKLGECSNLPIEWIQQNRPMTNNGRMLMRRPTFVGEAGGRSCSETSLYPVQYRIPQLIPRSQLCRTSSGALHSFEGVNAKTAVSKKQRKWQSSVEISIKSQLANFPGGPGTGLVQHRQPVKKAGVMRTVSLRTKSRHHRLMGTYAKSESDHSEYSAECASLFHSTIVETSEDDVSDYTTNRFGDSESSESDSDAGTSSSSLTLDCEDTDETEIVWVDSSVNPPLVTKSMTRPLYPEPKICRIKASKALKKKIRRFQPASLKVMTMV
ncbi:dapper homolog 2 [Bombina bombina]|uniref:dapper homolog 2 n=1 Tax=Bombina bombina TaxID=8345 RepID=UPI00235B066E|nr:dapper homolog 2 [Bombina bombina]